MTYRYNPHCDCDWCANDGEVPRGTPSNGHSFGFGNPHVPPARRTARITALLSWYNEPTAWLDRCVRSLTHLNISRLVALDGAYQHYPDAEPYSDQEQAHAIRVAAQEACIPVTLEQPDTVWSTEVAKRNHLFELAETTPADWYFVIDADEYVTEAPDDVREQLATTVFDVAAVTLLEPGHPLGTMVFPTHPKFFRAIPGLRAIQDHFTYTTPDGRRLWGDQKRHYTEARHDLTSVKVEHHNQLRHSDRRSAALEYYRTRDELGIEDLPAERSLLKDAA